MASRERKWLGPRERLGARNTWAGTGRVTRWVQEGKTEKSGAERPFLLPCVPLGLGSIGQLLLIFLRREAL